MYRALALPLALIGAAISPGQTAWATPPLEERPSGVSRQVAVTFDDLPVISVVPLDAAGKRVLTRKLLAAISADDVPAVGFVNEYGLYGFGKEVLGNPDETGVDLLRWWLEAGLELGNHTFAHVDLHNTTVDAFQRDVLRGEAVTRRLLAEKGRRLRYFRHPYLHAGRDLATKRKVERFLLKRRYRIAPVTVVNDDWVFAEAYSRAAQKGDDEMMRRIVAEYLSFTRRMFEHNEAASRKLFGREIKLILLLHANALNADHFGQLARMMSSRGYSFITLDDALRDEAYSSPDTYTGHQSLDWLARWAVTRGVAAAEHVLDDFPRVPEMIVAAARE